VNRIIVFFFDVIHVGIEVVEILGILMSMATFIRPCPNDKTFISGISP
jgi:hypothetical protein